MKRVLRIIFSSLIIFLITFSAVSAQQENTGQKIKIVVADDSGTKVISDTIMKSGYITDTIRLKDGNVFYITKTGDEAAQNSPGGTKHVYVTVSNDGKETKKEIREITIVCSDSSKTSEESNHNQMFFYSDTKEPGVKTDTKYNITTRTSIDTDGREESITYINDSDNQTEKVFEFSTDSDRNDASVKKTTYVIAKDGIVVTVEGNDEAKTKELIREIEKKLGVKNEEAVKEETSKTKTKKTEKNRE